MSFALLAELTRRPVFFVTHLKEHNRVSVAATRPAHSNSGRGSRRGGRGPRRGGALRRVTYIDAASARRYVFLTNNFRTAARTIADPTRRAGTTSCLQWLKQNLRIKSFFGATTNAALTQIWIAPCAPTCCWPI